jgi:hypothetical protein
VIISSHGAASPRRTFLRVRQSPRRSRTPRTNDWGRSETVAPTRSRTFDPPCPAALPRSLPRWPKASPAMWSNPALQPTAKAGGA